MLPNYFLTLVAVLLYLYGFFPIPPLPNELTSNSTNFGFKHAKPAKFARVVLLVIDAMRLDFITPKNTPFMSSQVKENGCLCTLKAQTPTVTLPRIKALTTGSVPQFVDIILNLASHQVLSDSIIHRAHAADMSIVFYGDDTWLNIIPKNMFKRSEGTNSFYVTDFYEVDNNVTRNVDYEIEQEDWDFMILHYLGLDHIGHVFGPKSHLIPIKLLEMDDIVRKIHSKFSDRDDFLMVVTSDHGMRDGGGHGGATYHETTLPLLLLTPSLKCLCDDLIHQQSDLPVNLAMLMGFDIPSPSVGQLWHKSLLGNSITLRNYLDMLKYNTLLLRQKLDLCESDFQQAEDYHHLFLLSNNSNSNHGDSARDLYEQCSKLISDKLLNSMAEQNVPFLIISIVLLLSIFLVQCYSFVALKNVLFVLLFIPMTFGSSSFIEEEHQSWFFLFTTILVFLLMETKSPSLLSLLLITRLLHNLNQVGDKWASEPDFSDWLLHSDNSIYLHLFTIVSLSLVYYCGRYSDISGGLILGGIFIFRVFDMNVTMGQLLWVSIFVYFFMKLDSINHVTILTVTLLVKPHNIILVPICIFASDILHDTLPKKGPENIMCHLSLGNLLYFAQGHDNSLARIDIATAYIGLSSYQPFFIIPQLVVHTYAFHLLAHCLLLFRNKDVDRRLAFSLFLLYRLLALLNIFIVSVVNRHHLFIWSVFAPKIIIESAHFAFLFIEFFIMYLCNLL